MTVCVLASSLDVVYKAVSLIQSNISKSNIDVPSEPSHLFVYYLVNYFTNYLVSIIHSYDNSMDIINNYDNSLSIIYIYNSLYII